MSATPRRPGSSGAFAGRPATADPTDWILIAGGSVLGLGVVLWCGAALACLVTGRGVPDGGALVALGALGSVGDPGRAWPTPEQLPGPVPYWGDTLPWKRRRSSDGRLSLNGRRSH